ncbi:hypothetical protein [uncultured Jannaschia sp.]|uniref:hypothetical protein n=1 Tax=uncultured Jannaschia sp. TaxID=293347 RepID=UPI002636EC0A|nr:hypothetical protein [uncultured Jannaschia sp.]
MLDWITTHSTAIQTMTGIVTALIWVAYLQLIVAGIVRHRRPQLTINRGGGQGFDAHILLSNLGSEPVYVANVVLSIHDEGGVRDVFITDRNESDRASPHGDLTGTLQGPLDAGAYRDIGTITGIFGRLSADAAARDTADIRKLGFTVLGFSRAATGARKTYEIIVDAGGVTRLRPVGDGTQRLSARACRTLAARFGSDV